MAVLDAGDPVRFSVRAGDEDREIFSANVNSREIWTDATVPLLDHAGQTLRISLEARSEGGNVAFWSSPRISGAPPRRLHVLVLLEDALRADRLSAYGHSRPTSPHHDGLASRGVLFEYAYAQATKTRPSCPSFMTSLLPSATGVWDHYGSLADAYLTLAETLRSQGFTTASFLQNSNAGPAAGLHQGFDHVFGPARLGAGPEIFDAVRDWMLAHRDRNLFVYVHVLDPHGVYDPPPPFESWYREEGPGATATAPNRRYFDPARVEAPTAEGRRLLYDGEVRHNDHQLGRLLAALDAGDVLDDTLVVSIADHGEHLGEHGQWGHDPPGTAAVLRVPMIFAHPSLPAGRRVAASVQLLDLMPTLLELAGVDPGELPLQGDSLLPLLKGDARASEALNRRVVVSEEPTRFGDRARPRRSGSVFFGDIQVLRSATEDGARVLRRAHEDAANDDEELRTQLEAETDALLDGLSLADREIREALGRGSADELRLDPEAQEQLRALGYLE